MVYYSALHYAAKAAKSAEAAADSATQASESSGKIIQVGFDGTLADGVLTFKHAPGGVEVPYNLQDDFEYELDLAFANTASLPTNTQMVIKNGNDTIRFVSALHREATTNATVADMDAVMRFNSSTGYRWLFKAAYKVTPSGAKVFLLYPVVAKEDTTKITNCITEIPQDIKLELNNGTLTLKAGSKVYVPNGVGVFDEVVISADRTIAAYGTSLSGLFLCVHKNGDYILVRPNYVSSGATAPTDVTNRNIWYDTTNNVIKTNSPGSSEFIANIGFPLAIVSCDGTKYTSIDQVFNGFGYIGSTVFALPNVKGLIPNGRNEDGSLKNIEFTTSKVITQTMGGTRDVYPTIDSNGNWGGYYSTYLEQETQPTNPANYTMWFNPADNTIKDYVSNAWTVRTKICPIISHVTSDKIDAFTPKLPFRAADDQEVAKLAGNNVYSGSNTYTATATGTQATVGFAAQNNSIDPSITASARQFTGYDFRGKDGIRLGYIGVIQDPGDKKFRGWLQSLQDNMYWQMDRHPVASDNSFNIATTGWVNNALRGSIMAYGGSTAPAGWLKCDGSAVSRTTYSALFAIIGTTYGTGNGSTTFNLPNLTSARVLKGSSVAVKGSGSTFKLANSATATGGDVTATGNSSVDGRKWLWANFENGTAYVSKTGDSGMVADISGGVAVNYIIKY